MSTSGSSASWVKLLAEKRLEVEESLGQSCRIRGEINTDYIFRDEFELLCKRRREYRPTRLEAQLFPSLIPITGLAKAVSKSNHDLDQLPPKYSLEGLIWSISFAIIEYGDRAGATLHSLVSSLSNLNQIVPSLSSGIGSYTLRFPNEKRVQEPLQQVYTVFIDSQLFFLTYVKERDPKLDQDLTKDPTIEIYIKTTKRLYERARGRYDVLVTQVAEDEEREKAENEQYDSPSRKIQVRFVTKRLLGRGSFGEVDEVRELSTGASYARKHIFLDVDKSRQTIAEEVINEVQVMQKLRHLHIATVLFYLKQGETYSIFMLPVAEYDLGRFMQKCAEEEFPAGRTKKIYPWFGCLLDALAYAHKIKIKHQDIKPSNILIKNDQPYLCDFGLAKDFADTDASKSHGAIVIGSRLYHAPEVRPRQERGRKADVFALGCVYSEMLTVCKGKWIEDYRDARLEGGSTVFRDCLKTVRNWVIGFETSQHPDRLDGLLVDVILGMIEEDHNQRLSSEQALNSLKDERALFCVE